MWWEGREDQPLLSRLHYSEKPPLCSLRPPHRDMLLLISSPPTFTKSGMLPVTSCVFKNWHDHLQVIMHESKVACTFEKAAIGDNCTLMRVFNYSRAYHCLTITGFRKCTILVNYLFLVKVMKSI